MSLRFLMPAVALIFFACAADEPKDINPPSGRGALGKADAVTGSCEDESFCGGQSDESCWCDDSCATYGDCCADAAPVCGVVSNRIEDRTAGMTPLLDEADLELVADLPNPPGNVTVAPDGRVFFTFHPEGRKQDTHVAELVGDTFVPFPSAAFQDRLQTVLSIRIDRQNRLWMLDFGKLALHRPRLYAVDLDSRELVFDYEFPHSAARFGSMLNDFQVAPDGKTIYISDQSSLAHQPAIVVVDIDRAKPIARRRLQAHPSVSNGPYDVFVDDIMVRALGIRPDYGIDGIALDHSGDFLYYSALNTGELYKVATADLRFEVNGLDDDALAARIEKVADITLADGIATDAEDNVYITSMEQFAVTRVDRDGNLEVLFADRRLRWADGFGWSPDGHLYVTASALHQYMPELHKSDAEIHENAPYQIYRFLPQLACSASQSCTGHPGH